MREISNTSFLIHWSCRISGPRKVHRTGNVHSLCSLALNEGTGSGELQAFHTHPVERIIVEILDFIKHRTKSMRRIRILCLIFEFGFIAAFFNIKLSALFHFEKCVYALYECINQRIWIFVILTNNRNVQLLAFFNFFNISNISRVLLVFFSHSDWVYLLLKQSYKRSFR